MERLKCCFEASNALKNADDNTCNLCFDEIMKSLFGSKRGLMKFLLTPNAKLNKEQVIQIKDILNPEMKRLIDVQAEESDGDDIAVKTERIIPKLTNISEHAQVHITSFLDFESIKNLSAVCMSIAPIALSQFAKIDIKICNVHQLNNDDQYIKTYDIIRANAKTFRVRRSDNPKMFIHDKFGIEPENVVAFDTYDLTDKPTIFEKKPSYEEYMVIGDETKLVIHHNGVPRKVGQNFGDCHYRLLFVQQFDVKRQRLNRKQIAMTNQEISVTAIKNMVGNDDVILFLMDDDSNEMSNVFYRLSRDFTIDLYELSHSYFIYQDSMTDEEYKNMENEFHQNLEPFYSSASEFYRVQGAERIRPGKKYIELDNYLKRKGFDAKERAQYFKKAYDINPNDPVLIYYYIATLAESDVDDKKTALDICLEKLNMYEKGDMQITDDYLWKFFSISAEIYSSQKQFEMSIKYYESSIGTIERLLAGHSTKRLRLRLCSMYHRMIDIYNLSSINVDQEAIGRKYYEKILRRVPQSAFYLFSFGRFLLKLEKTEDYEEAWEYIDESICVHVTEDDTPELKYSLHDLYCEILAIFMEMKEYQKAERIALNLTRITKDEDNEREKYISN